MSGADRCILFSFAHPDDESFSGAGTAMKYGAAGVRTDLAAILDMEIWRQGWGPPISRRPSADLFDGL